METHQKSANQDGFLQKTPKRYVLNRHYDDFEDFSDTVRNWKIEFRQLESGYFQGTTFQAKSGDVHFEYASLNRHFDQHGESPSGLRTLVIPATPDQRFKWRGHNVTGNTIAIFPERGELNAVSKNGFKIFSISLPQAQLAELVSSIDSSALLPSVLNNELLTIPPENMLPFRDYLGGLYRQLTWKPSLIHHNGFAKEIETEVIQKMLTVLATSTPSGQQPPTRLRTKAIKKSMAYIFEFGDRPIKISELCKFAGVSLRTLEYAFLDHFGISPKTYLSSYKLNNVRKQLLQSHPSEISIVDIANKWNFWHMGQFARDYRRLFGELPSETLGKKS
ncbi:MAG: helix-turn-helix domain-containing protein [Desulfobulbaceae bacterium]|nr:helix-turn-helix domain-containing protein [Desulfobulbaceae bacterium]